MSGNVANNAVEQHKCGSRAVQVWLVSNASVAREQCKCLSRAVQALFDCVVKEVEKLVTSYTVRGIARLVQSFACFNVSD